MKLPTRTEVLNFLAQQIHARWYLEIGVRNRRKNFNFIRCPKKHCVDPDPRAGATFEMPSDEFFAQHPNNRYDLIFVDGLHTSDQVARDIRNSLIVLRPRGIIAIHDVNPKSEFAQRDEPGDSLQDWNGTVWVAFTDLRMNRPDLQMMTVDTCDGGVGIIRPGLQTLYTEPVSGYEDFARDRAKILNLVKLSELSELLT